MVNFALKKLILMSNNSHSNDLHSDNNGDEDHSTDKKNKKFNNNRYCVGLKRHKRLNSSPTRNPERIKFPKMKKIITICMIAIKSISLEALAALPRLKTNGRNAYKYNRPFSLLFFDNDVFNKIIESVEQA